MVRFHLMLGLFLGSLGTLILWWLVGGKNDWSMWLGRWLVSINVITFVYYGFDKSRAGTGRRRVPEKVLHGLSIVGGSPGAYLAMNFFRHKTIKGKFRIFFWCIVVVQVLLVLLVIKKTWWA